MQEIVCERLWELSGAGPNGMMIPAGIEKIYIYVETDGVERPKGVCVSFWTRHDGSVCVCILQPEFMGNSHDMIHYIYEIR